MSCKIERNEKADKLAKTGAQSALLGPQSYARISLRVVKHAKKKWLQNQLSNHWRNTPKLNHSKKMIELPTTESSRILSNLNRKQLRILKMLLTGDH